MVPRDLLDNKSFAPLAQSVEHLTFNQVVVGSIPTGRTIKTVGQAVFAWPILRLKAPLGSVSKGQSSIPELRQPRQEKDARRRGRPIGMERR